MYPENMSYSQAPVTDFTDFVNVSSINKKFVGKQLNVLYDGLTSMAKAVKTVVEGVGNIKQIQFAKSQDGVTGYMHEYTGTESKNLKTSAVISSNAVKTVIMSNKRESDDLLIDGYEEVYNSATGEYIGGEVCETVKAADYDTLWLGLKSVEGINSVKILPENNGLNADTVFINGSGTPLVAKLVGGISLKTASRRYDIEMKDVWYVVKTEVDGEISYDKIKTQIPMLFVQSDNTLTFSEDFIEKNPETAATLPSVMAVTSEYESLQVLFKTVREKIAFADIISYIGEKNAFFVN